MNCLMGGVKTYHKGAEAIDELISDFSTASEELFALIDSVFEAINGASDAANDGEQSTSEIASRTEDVR